MLGIGVRLPLLARVANSRYPAPLRTFWQRVRADSGTMIYMDGATAAYRATLAVSPSLLTTASAYKAGVIYSVLPTDGSGDFAVVRAGTTAYTQNPDGTWRPAAANEPRYTYENGVPAILVEASGQNLALRSEGFDVSGTWIPTSQGLGSVPIVTPNYTTSPDGLNNGFRLQSNLNGGTTSNDRSWLVQNISSAQTNTAQSVYAKLNSSGTAVFSVANNDGALVTLTSTDWVRVATIRTGASANPSFRIGLVGVSGASNTIDISIWGAQLETGSVATSYIKTTTAAETRNADVISKTGASALIGQTEGTIYVTTDIQLINTLGCIISINNEEDETNQDIVTSIRLFRDNQNKITTYTSDSVGFETKQGAAVTSAVILIEMSYSASRIVVKVNGLTYLDFVPTIYPIKTLDIVRIGSRFNQRSLGAFYNGSISNLYLK